MFANDQHETSKLLVDIAGGLAVDVFCFKDWMNPEERPYIEKYLAGRDGVPTEHRLRLFRMIKDLVGENRDAIAIHGEGSLAQQQMAMFASTDWERYRPSLKELPTFRGGRTILK